MGAGAAVGLTLTVGLVAAACGASPAARDVRHTAPTTSAPTSTTVPTTTTVPSAVPTTVPSPVVPTVGWAHPATTLPPAGGYTGVSCISGVFCVSIGGGANEADVSDSTGPGVVNAWDGAVWGTQSVYFPEPAGGAATAPELPGIACTTGPLCALVDGSGHTSLGDGTNWSAPAALSAAPAVPANPADPGTGHEGARSAAVDCPTGQFCAYVDNTGHVAVLRGTSWSALQTMTTRVGPATVGLFQSGRGRRVLHRRLVVHGRRRRHGPRLERHHVDGVPGALADRHDGRLRRLLPRGRCVRGRARPLRVRPGRRLGLVHT